MPDTVTTSYSLTEAADVLRPWLSASTLPDVLARPSVVPAGVEQPAPTRYKIVIRKWEIEGSTPPPSFLESVHGVADLLALPPGWNSYSAKPIAPQNAIRAIELLAELVGPATPPAIVVPTVRGGIQLEWHTRGVNIEVYVDSPESVSFFAEQVESGHSQEEPVAGHEHELKLWLQRISEK